MLRNQIFRKLRIHTVPTLHFVLDTSVQRGFAMDQVIDRAMRVTRAGEKDGE
jgi:ribosome-binding factor A